MITAVLTMTDVTGTLIVFSLVGCAISLFRPVNPRVDALAKKHAAWHEKCDAYQEVPRTDPTAQACSDELLELIEEAKTVK